MKILITGVAGFIGFHTAKKLINENHFVTGIDNLNNYYDCNLKIDRLKNLESNKNFNFQKIDITNREKLESIFLHNYFDIIIHLAAQPGVRHSLNHPQEYIDTNLSGFFNILDESKKNKVKHFIYASSSSVYGANEKTPFSEEDSVDHPISLYAATKRSNELIAHSYSHLYNLPVTGLRLFTVYGPWGRPDMAPFIFTNAILKGKEISLFNNGDNIRDFTYIDDVIDKIYETILKIPKKTKNNSYPNKSKTAPFEIINISSNQPTSVNVFINVLEELLNQKAKKVFIESQPGDLISTNSIECKINSSNTKLEEGLKNFIDWFREYYKV